MKDIELQTIGIVIVIGILLLAFAISRHSEPTTSPLEDTSYEQGVYH